MYVIWALVGLLLGAFVDQGWTGAAVGLVLGLFWARLEQLRKDLDETRARLAALDHATVSGDVSVRDAAGVDASSQVAVADIVSSHEGGADGRGVDELGVDERGTGEGVVGDGRGMPPGLPVEGRVVPPPVPASSPGGIADFVSSYNSSHDSSYNSTAGAAPAEPVGPSLGDRVTDAVKRWFTEGNVPVKVGMLVLFAGVAAFLKYAADNGLLRVPVSVRLMVVALAAMGGVAFGWMQRDTRRPFALALQGGGVGVLVMTVFAAYRLYGLLPAGPTFGLLIVFVAGLGVLAVVQDALALALLGLIAGFAAPIMASTGQGDHVALFSYYAVLNLCILGIAWKKAWRVLNVLGFVATFGIGTAWGVLSYKPYQFASTEPFLVLHFLLYLAVPFLHVLRSPKRERAILDGCLMFGNPIASLLLQGALLDWAPMPLAISTLIAAAVYVAIAFAIRRRDDMRLLRETWAVLAVAFATIAVPLALSASVTASVFALEGAGLIWLGFRQGRRLPRWSGVFLQLVAGVAWGLALAFSHHSGDMPFLNASFIGSLLLVLGASVGVWQFDRHGMSRGVSGLARIGLLVWAVAWWLGGFGNEIARFVPDPAAEAAAWLALIAVTGWLLAEACPRARKLDLGVVLAFAVPLAFAISLGAALGSANEGIQLLSGWPLAAVAVTAVTGWLAMRGEGKHRIAAVATGTLWWLRWLGIFTASIALALQTHRSIGQGWIILACAVPTLVIAALTLWWPRVLASPLAVYLRDIRLSVGASMVLAMFFVGVTALGAEGSTRPLPFVPVLNPVDLLLIAVWLFIARTLSDEALPASVRRVRPAALAVAFFIVATSMTLRAVHHLGGVSWNTSMPDSSLAELSLTIVWSVIGVVAWVLGSKRGQRMLWLAGAATMAIVLLKLLLVDRGHLGNLFGIASFMAYGLLCTVIGYFAPAPPKQAAVPLSESQDAS